MKELFKATIFKTSEEDNFKNGVIGKTQDLGIVQSFESEYLTSLISSLIGEFGSDFVRNVENFESQIDYSRQENQDGIEPYQSEIKLFKDGEINLYLSTYSIYIERKIVSDFSEFETEMVINIIKKAV